MRVFNKKISALTQTVLAVCVAAVMFLPIYYMVLNSVKPSENLLTTMSELWLERVDFTPYLNAWSKVPLGRYFFNTAFVTVISVLSQTVLGVMAAYGFSKGSFKGKNLLFLLVIGALMIPTQVTFIPLYTLCARFGLVNSYLGIILPNTISAYFIFMVRQAFLTVDQSYIDAGKIDGLGTMGIIWHIMVPMCKSTIITVLLVTFIGSWNDYFWPKIITNKDEYRLLSVGLVRLYDLYGSNEVLESMNSIMACAVITALPIVIVFIIFQKHMLNGLSKAAMK